MQRIYLILSVLLLSIEVSAQQPPGNLSEGAIVRKGDVFSVRLTDIPSDKRVLLRNAIRVAGAAVAGYQTEKIMAGDAKRNSSVAKNNWLPPLGAGLILFSDKLAGHKKTAQQYVTYAIYDKDGVAKQTGLIRLDSKNIRKNAGVVLTGTAAVDGLMKVDFLQDGQDATNAPGYVIDIVPGTEHVYAASPITISKQPSASFDIAGSLHLSTISSDKISAEIVPAPTEVEGNKVVNTTASETPAIIKTKILVKNSIKATPVAENTTLPVKSQFAGNPRTTTQKKNPPPNPPFLSTVDWIKHDPKFEPVSEDGIEDYLNREKNHNFWLSSIAPPQSRMTIDTGYDDGVNDDDDDDYGDDGDVDYGDDYGEDDYGGDDGSDDGGDDTADDAADDADTADISDDADTADISDDSDDGDYTGTGITSGDILYIDGDGNEYILAPGETYDLDDGETVTINEDGSVQVVVLPEVTVTATINKSTAEIALSAMTLGEDTQTATFSAIQYASEAEGVLESLGNGFTIASIITGGLPAAIHIIRDLYNGSQISLHDVISLFFAVLAALGLAFGMSELLELLVDIGATIWDVIDMLN